MATSKAKRPIPLAQPLRRSLNPKTNSGSIGLMPVKTYIYHSIAELNGGFEKVTQELQTLEQVNFFSRERVKSMRELVCRMRAEANRDFTIAMHTREKANARTL
jgi:hypothetical protein